MACKYVVKCFCPVIAYIAAPGTSGTLSPQVLLLGLVLETSKGSFGMLTDLSRPQTATIILDTKNAIFFSFFFQPFSRWLNAL